MKKFTKTIIKKLKKFLRNLIKREVQVYKNYIALFLYFVEVVSKKSLLKIFLKNISGTLSSKKIKELKRPLKALISYLGIVFSKLDSIPPFHKLFIKIRGKYEKSFIKIFIRDVLLHSHLPWGYLLKLGYKNVSNSGSRAVFTILGISLGTGAIVFLISFAYGIQNIVEKRLIKPNSLRMLDVQSDSTSLELDQKALEQIKSLGYVEDVVPSVSLAGNIQIGDVKTDVFVIGANNKYLDYSYIRIVAGKRFSAEAESEYIGQTYLDKTNLSLANLVTDFNKVLGIKDTNFSPTYGDKTTDNSEVKFKVLDYTYIPIYDTPNESLVPSGYITGGSVETFEAFEVWGGPYRSLSTVGKYLYGSDDNWYGKWLKVENMPIYKKSESGYEKLKNGEEQLYTDGFITQRDVYILTDRELSSDKLVEKYVDKYSGHGQVLGDTDVDDSEIYSITIEESSDPSTTESSKSTEALKQFVQENEGSSEPIIPDITLVEISKSGGKEIIISSFLVKTLDLSPKDLLGKQVNLTYILSGGLVSNLNGRVVSEDNIYTVVGIYNEEEKPIIIAPLQDLVSVGLSKYTTAKVLVEEGASLSDVRSPIQALGFNSQTISDTLVQVQKFFSLIRFLLGFIGLMALVVSVVGMINTLTVTLLERTREVGVMKTLGTTNIDVAKLFVIESTLLATIGGVIGIILGILVGNGVNILVFALRREEYLSLFRTPPLFIVLMIFVSVVLGVITGYYPAKRSSKISGLEALRYE